VKLSGRTALLTGATGGLGRAMAAALARRGAKLVLTARKAERLEQLARELPGDHRVIAVDLDEEGAAERLAAEAGEVDCLVANAGLPGTGQLDDYSQQGLTRVLRLNLELPVRLTRELLPGMRERGDCHLVYISSLSGKYASARSSLYNATKFGLRGFAFGLREDLRRTGIGVSVISPGPIADAGIFAESGAKPPALLGAPRPVKEVGEAVVRAIERNRAEIAVASRRARLGAHIALVTPALSGRVSRREAIKVAEGIDRGRQAAESRTDDER
jgi:short-subunit dehydrogenase